MSEPLTAPQQPPEVRPFSPRTRTLHDAVITATANLRDCETEVCAARDAVDQAQRRFQLADVAEREARRQLNSFVEAVISDVFSPSVAVQLCRNLQSGEVCREVRDDRCTPF